MTVETRIDGDGVHIHLTGWDSVLGFAREIHVNRDDVVSAQVLDWEGVRTRFGRRLASAYLPRHRAGGWFLVTKGRQHLVWCWLERGEPALVIRTRRFRPGQIAVVASSVVREASADWFSQQAS